MQDGVVFEAVAPGLVLRGNDHHGEIPLNDHHLAVVLTEAHLIVGRAQHGVHSCRLLRCLEVREEVGRAHKPLVAQGNEFAQELLACGVSADRDAGSTRKGEQMFQDIAELEGVSQNDLHLALARVVDSRFRLHGQ